MDRQKHPQSKSASSGAASNKAAAPPDPQAAVEARRTKSFQQAHAARHYSIPAALSCIIGDQDLDGMSAKTYLDTILLEAGKPTDPVQRMMLEHLTLAHHRIASLHVKAASATSLEAVKMYNAAVVRMEGEFRRQALAYKSYSQPPSQKSFSVVHQQNVVASGQQSVAYVADGSEKETLLVVRDDLAGKAPDAVEQRINGHGNLNKESQAGGSRKTKRTVAEAAIA